MRNLRFPLSLIAASSRLMVTCPVALLTTGCPVHLQATANREVPHPRRHDLALLDHGCHHIAVLSARLHVRTQEVARAQVHQPKLLHKLCALHAARCASARAAAREGS